MGKLRGVLRICLRGAMRKSPLFKVEACPALKPLPVTFFGQFGDHFDEPTISSLVNFTRLIGSDTDTGTIKKRKASQYPLLTTWLARGSMQIC